MKKKVTFLLYFAANIASNRIAAQPYIDIVNAKYVKSPGNNTVLEYYNVATNIPLQYNKKQDAIILSPCAEIWKATVSIGAIQGSRETYYGIILPVSWLKQLRNPKWKLLSTFIIRANNATASHTRHYQAGGAAIVSYKSSPNLTWKAGVYVNDEYSGFRVIPLYGIDWRINATTYLFGVLPGSMVFEKRIYSDLYGGACFRAITNSYAKDTRDIYWRIDENQLGAYADFYCTKNIVLTADAGHSLFRRIRATRYNNGVIEKYSLNPDNNFYFKIAAAFRIRLKQ